MKREIVEDISKNNGAKRPKTDDAHPESFCGDRLQALSRAPFGDSSSRPSPTALDAKEQIRFEMDTLAALAESKRMADGDRMHIPSKRPRFLPNGLHLTYTSHLPRSCNENAFTLRQIVEHVKPLVSIHYNFQIDPAFVMDQFGRYSTTPMTFVVGDGDFANSLRECCTGLDNITIRVARLPYQYGTHHTKLSLFESEDALHILVSTANLTSDDYYAKTQLFYYYRAPFQSFSPENGDEKLHKETRSEDEPKPGSSRESAFPQSRSSPFLEDLVAYLSEAYKYLESTNYWVSRLRDGDADFSACYDRLVFTRPGYSPVEDKKSVVEFFQGRKATTKNSKTNEQTSSQSKASTSTGSVQPWGHLMLRRRLAESFSPEELANQREKIIQCSSIGQLGQMQDWLFDEFLRSLSGNNTSNMQSKNLKVIFPTAENVRQSADGYSASLFFSCHSYQPYLKRILHQWKSESLIRTRIMPHCKVYAGIEDVGISSTQSDTSTSMSSGPRICWLLVTSANLSKSAWGALNKSGSHLFCRSYELGILLLAKNYPNWMRKSPLPFDYPLLPYDYKDTPFFHDQTNAI